MIDYTELKISQELIKKLKAWIKFYDSKCTSKKTYCVLKSKEKALNKRGLALAKDLKKELPKIEIFYVSESPKNIGTPKIISRERTAL